MAFFQQKSVQRQRHPVKRPGQSGMGRPAGIIKRDPECRTAGGKLTRSPLVKSQQFTGVAVYELLFSGASGVGRIGAEPGIGMEQPQIAAGGPDAVPQLTAER